MTSRRKDKSNADKKLVRKTISVENICKKDDIRDEVIGNSNETLIHEDIKKSYKEKKTIDSLFKQVQIKSILLIIVATVCVYLIYYYKTHTLHLQNRRLELGCFNYFFDDKKTDINIYLNKEKDSLIYTFSGKVGDSIPHNELYLDKTRPVYDSNKDYRESSIRFVFDIDMEKECEYISDTILTGNYRILGYPYSYNYQFLVNPTNPVDTGYATYSRT